VGAQCDMNGVPAALRSDETGSHHSIKTANVRQ